MQAKRGPEVRREGRKERRSHEGPALAEKPGLSLTERAYEALREDILHGRLRPGEPIAEAVLADRFNVSKTPVREALRLLAHEDLVLVLPRKGYVVRPLGFDDVAEIFALRALLEPGVAADAARRRLPHHVAALRQALEAYVAATEWRDQVLRSLAFHEQLCEAAGNGRRTRIVSDLLFEAHRFWLLDPVEPPGLSEAAEGHYRAMLAAVEDGDPDAAAVGMTALLEHVRSLLVTGWVAAPTPH